ncbi:MAG TPA: hypothetical protein VGO55_13545 [Allosphingosinicella sp.]|jgi:hypothetical protein|nr:hypothetical protein [Allosphingosinicella sp.]
MSDGCWVQFWGDEYCAGATLRFDADSGTLAVADLDDYTQSDGSKEGNEPNSLETGTRTWLVVYKDDDFEGKEAMFGPNTRVDDLDAFGVGGNISSFRIYDSRPSWFNESTLGGPVAYETNDGLVDAASVNNFFRTVVAAGLNLIPVVGGALGTLVGGLWPDVDQKDQVWGSFQNYLNQSIAGVYWQKTYESLNDTLETLFKAATDFVETPDQDEAIKKQAFENLYNLVNNTEAFFVDKEAPEKRFSFLVPFATLRLATLRENLQHYAYYYGSEPSQGEADRLTLEIRDSIALYQRLLSEARTRILDRRGQMIFVEDDLVLIDLYYGSRWSLPDPDRLDSRRYRVESVLNKLALTLDEHIAVSQLWPHFDPAVTGPVEPPILNYVSGPMGYYWYGHQDFSEVADQGRITAITLWTYSGGPNPPNQNGLELYIDGSAMGRKGGEGGTPQTLDLASDDSIVDVNGKGSLEYLRFVSNDGKNVTGGNPDRGGSDFQFVPLPDTLNGRVVGVSGSAGDVVDAIAVHWRCALPIDTKSPPEPA